MSGCSDSGPCPRCGGNMSTYTDWKPVDYMSGECHECGFYYYTMYRVMNKKALNEVRKERKENGCNDEKIKPLDKSEVRKFDKMLGIARDR